MDLQPDPPGDSPSSPSTSGRLPAKRNPLRSRNGCWTCRTKKVKCDEVRPQCGRCSRLKLLCDYAPRRKRSRMGWQQAVQGQHSDPDAANSTDNAHDINDRSQSLVRCQDSAKSLSVFRPSAPDCSASSVVLIANDHDAIRYFRTTFAKLHHTKNPDYSLYSIMFKIAEVDPIVMHMVLAVGGREMEFHKKLQIDHSKGARTPMWHYSSALQLMAQMIGTPSKGRLDFDAIYTAVYLMLLYEQKFGDDKCVGFMNHLDGAALILKHYCGDMNLPPPTSGSRQRLALTFGEKSNQSHDLSLYAARIIMWVVQFDSAAASYGVDSRLNTTLHEIMMTCRNYTKEHDHLALLDKLEQLHHFSSPLYGTVWGKEYPQDELVDDIENKNVFFLEGACAQLRLMTAQLDRLDSDEKESGERWARDIMIAIDNVNSKFGDLIEVAAGLSPLTNNAHRLVANMRRVVPFFHAAVLYFFRVRSKGSRDQQPLTEWQNEALSQIMSLAFQAHKYDGEQAMVQLAWPLFMVALETNDHLHREWALSQFSAISKCGVNFERAYRFLVATVELQSRLGRRVDVRDRLRSGEFGMFVI
ncbi:hypothetical protein FSARC_11618 [Fusarium sarcochroum]|uniref:Zn(2)-C6 fungal-type domain-containing protein n=1 Tax=Fusarium sarcochroum TaxID=1208366 RepID=A0A8H4TEN0_9HYPO|nr:hypothetical protein FSARC_11618 [Fusarium sarcochroum]